MAVALFVCFYCCSWLFCSSAGSARLKYDNLLPPLLRELAERPLWKEGIPGPQSVAIKYMKLFYKMSVNKEGVPKANKNTNYNTVRLFTPKRESKSGPRKDPKSMKSLDLSFRISSISTLEQHLRSVLLYSVRKKYISSNITCSCSLEIINPETASPAHSSPPYKFEIQLKKRQRWAEVDVTSFFQPFVSNRQNIHFLFNMTCTRNKVQHSSGMDEPLKIARSPPCLLLYLNDTSNKAYHRTKRHRYPSAHVMSLLKRLVENYDISKELSNRRGRSAEEDFPTIESIPYNMSELANQFVYHQNECELHKFRLSFSQLNWDRWILAPHWYSPNYCKGDCPRVLNHRYGSPMHTMVQNILYEKLGSTIPRPSCVPSEYRPMSVLTLEPDKSIAYKEYQDMIATKCTCR